MSKRNVFFCLWVAIFSFFGTAISESEAFKILIQDETDEPCVVRNVSRFYQDHYEALQSMKDESFVKEKCAPHLKKILDSDDGLIWQYKSDRKYFLRAFKATLFYLESHKDEVKMRLNDDEEFGYFVSGIFCIKKLLHMAK